jgi:hypothetical protein
MRGGRYTYEELYKRDNGGNAGRRILLIHIFHACSSQQLHIKVSLLFWTDE